MNISILGCTGSVGRQTFKVLQDLPDVQVSALAAAGFNLDILEEQARYFHPKLIAVYNEDSAALLRKRLPKIKIAAGMDGLMEAAAMPDCQIVVNALVGSIGLKPTMAAIAARKCIALANKETLVAAGHLVMEAAQENQVEIRPMDSEHSAIWQCLQGNEENSVKRLILTASGGAFRSMDKTAIEKATAADALRHPNWDMGPKITVDCATMMNKGLEYIEARWLFDIPYEKIDILVHPQSIIHSMVEFEDGAVMAQMAAPDMAQPIQYALTAPLRPARKHKPLDFISQGQLTFTEPDSGRFPCLALALEAAKTGGTMPAMMNALNESLVNAFLRDEIAFYDISRLIQEAMRTYNVRALTCLTDVEEAELWASEFYERSKFKGLT